MSESAPIYVAVVDDDESQCRALSRLLRATGIQVITYRSGESFLADLKHPQFDCLVLDIQFAGMSGIELKKQLTAMGSFTPTIFITAHDEPEVRREALAAGGIAFFRKTAPGTAIIAAIQAALANAVIEKKS